MVAGLVDADAVLARDANDGLVLGRRSRHSRAWLGSLAELPLSGSQRLADEVRYLLDVKVVGDLIPILQADGDVTVTLVPIKALYINDTHT